MTSKWQIFGDSAPSNRNAIHTDISFPKFKLTEIKTIDVQWGIQQFFDHYVHDSYAGFIGQFGDKSGMLTNLMHIVAEPKRYLTYRVVYEGDDRQRNI